MLDFLFNRTQKNKPELIINRDVSRGKYKLQTLVLNAGVKLTSCKFEKCHIIYMGENITIENTEFIKCTNEYRNNTSLTKSKIIENDDNSSKQNNTPQSITKLSNESKAILSKAQKLINTHINIYDKHIYTFEDGTKIMTYSWQGKFKLDESQENVIYSATVRLAHKVDENTDNRLEIYHAPNQCIELNGIKFVYQKDE